MKHNTRIQAYFTDPTLQRSFRGHKDTITSCVFNPNMKQAISGSEDGNVIVWNFKPQMRPYKFIGHKSAVNDIAITPDGSTIASASNDDTVRLWTNSVNGSSQTIKAHTAPVRSVDFSYDGRLLLTGSNDKIIKIINVNDKKFQCSLLSHTNWIKCARFSPDARLIGSGSDDNTVKLWDVAQKSVIHTFIDHQQEVNSIRFHPDGTCIASGSVDKKIKIWDIRSKRLIQHYDAHAASVTCISFHPDGNYLVSSSMDATLKIWDLKMGQILYTLYGHEGPATTVNFSPDGDFFSTGGTDGILMVWKSNVRNMDQEFESLSKNSMAQMKSNKKKVEDDISSNKTLQHNKSSANALNQTKYKVIQPKSETIKPEVRVEKQLNQSNIFKGLPEELSSTFEKMICQLDIIAKTMKIMDQRIATVENQVTDLYTAHRVRKEEESFKRSHSSIKQNNSTHKVEEFKPINSGSFNPYMEGEMFDNKYIPQDIYINQQYDHYIPQDEDIEKYDNVVQNEIEDNNYGGYNNQFYEESLKMKNYDGTNVFNNNYQEVYPEEIVENQEHQVVTERDLEIFEDKDNHIEEIDIPNGDEKENI